VTSRAFVFGLGYTGLALAADLLDSGWHGAGTCRDDGKRVQLLEAGIDAFRFDGDAALADAGGALAGTTHVLSTIPPGEQGDPVLDLHAGHLAALPSLEWAGYISTTGVYGDRDGGWVDEFSGLRPSGERGRRRERDEECWFGLWREAGVPVHVFRAAGIYGPGRSILDALRAGSAHRIDKPRQVFSRVHVDDLVAALRASMSRPRAGAVYNVCDDEAAASADVTAHAAGLLGVEPPPLVPFEQADLSDMARSFYADSKRVRNTLIKEELGVTLRYPTYREGLKAILAGEQRTVD
jgi:nucleoside-diphosphate-sugar epimerase